MTTQGEMAGSWFWAFFRVAAAYLALWLLLPAVWLALALVFDPSLIDYFSKLAPEEFKRVAQNDPQSVFPNYLCVQLIGVMTLASCFAGFAVVRLSAPRQLQHAFFLAIIVFATYLQWALTRDSIFPQWVVAVLMSTCSLAILFGGRLASSNVSAESEPEDDE